MEIIVFILAVFLLVVWLSGRDATSQLRSEVETLQREMSWLREQLAELIKAQKTSQATSPPAPVTRAEPSPVPPAKPPEPAPAQPVVQHKAPPSVAAFTAAPAPVAPKPIEPVQPQPVPIPKPEAKPEFKPIPQLAAAPSAPKIPAPQPPKPLFATEEAASSREKLFSLEETLGANWLNKLGIVILVIGLAFFLAIKLQTWGPGGKVLCGYAISVLLLGGGILLERKPPYRVFARAIMGGGWALGFFTTFAMYHIEATRILNSLAADLVLMLIVAAGMVAHSLRYRSQTVTGLAFLLGFATLLTSNVESASDTVVFSLTASAVLAIALVVVTTLRHWAVLELLGMLSVYFSHLVWLTRVLPQNHTYFAEFWPSTALILLYWLIFRLAYVMRAPLDKSEENISSVSAVFNSGGVLGLLKFQSSHPEWAFWALLALGCLEMALAFWARPKRRQAFIVLSTIATVLLIASVPFRFHGVSWPILWLAQAQVLAICGLRLGEPIFRRLGLLTGLATGAVLAFHDVLPLALFRLDYPDPSRHWPLTAGLILAALLYWVHAEIYPRRWPKIVENKNEAFALKITSWLGLAAAAAALWVIVPSLWLPVSWLALVLLLGVAARQYKALHPAMQADLLAVATGVVLAFQHILPLAYFRLDNPDLSRHPELTTMLALSALAYWFYAEVLPRLLPLSGSDQAPTAALSLGVTSWLGTIAAAAALWAVLPSLWLPVGWLALVLLLGIAGRRFSAVHPAIQADVLATATGALLAFQHILPLAYFRLENADPSRHTALTAMLTLSALAYWIYAEGLPRLLPHREPNQRSTSAFGAEVTSWLGTITAAAALWVVLPSAWVVVSWLGLVLLLGLAADWVKAERQAMQADLLAVTSLIGLFFWDLWTQGWWDHKAPLLATVALLYAGMRRNTVLAGSRKYVAPAYSWAATLLLAFAATQLSLNEWLIPAWAALGLALFEIGRVTHKGFLRWQGFLLVAIGFVEYLGIEFWNEGPAPPIALTPAGYLADSLSFSFVHSQLLNLLVLVAAGYWLLERTRNRERCTAVEYTVGLAADALGTLSIALWFAYRFPSTWVPVPGGAVWVTAIWAAMATFLLALAWLLHRRAFLIQAVALAIAVVLRGWFLDLFVDNATGFWHGPLFHLSVAALALLGALPFAFKLRGPDLWADSSIQLPEELVKLLQKPEQWFFFAPFALIVVALAVKLTFGHITIGWSLLGVGVFLFALAVGERSYRLTGLGLLLVSVAKIVLIDIWSLAPSERYTTLIVLGAALLTVSFLYTRFSAVIRRYL